MKHKQTRGQIANCERKRGKILENALGGSNMSRWYFFLFYTIFEQIIVYFGPEYTVKKVRHFPVLSRDVTNQTLLGRELFNYSRPGSV